MRREKGSVQASVAGGGEKREHVRALQLERGDGSEDALGEPADVLALRVGADPSPDDRAAEAALRPPRCLPASDPFARGAISWDSPVVNAYERTSTPNPRHVHHGVTRPEAPQPQETECARCRSLCSLLLL